MHLESRILHKENNQNVQYFCNKFHSPWHYQTSLGLRICCLDLWGLYAIHAENCRTYWWHLLKNQVTTFPAYYPYEWRMIVTMTPIFQILLHIQNMFLDHFISGRLTPYVFLLWLNAQIKELHPQFPNGARSPTFLMFWIKDSSFQMGSAILSICIASFGIIACLSSKVIDSIIEAQVFTGTRGLSCF